jgi:hypothetical protein
MTLYELNDAIMGCVDEETGEVNGELLDALIMERNAKVENIALWVKQLKAEAEMLKAEKQALESRQKQKVRTAESLKNYLFTALDGQKFETTRACVSFRHQKVVNITDYTKIPDDYLRYKEPEADKVKIKAAIKDGISVPGAELVDSVSMNLK